MFRGHTLAASDTLDDRLARPDLLRGGAGTGCGVCAGSSPARGRTERDAGEARRLWTGTRSRRVAWKRY